MQATRPDSRRRLVAFILIAAAFALAALPPTVIGQTQLVTATPGSINLGMTTSIAVTAPGAGTFTVKVTNPSGAQVALNFTFSAAGQVQNATFGVAASGFKAKVDRVGAYNVFLEQGTQVFATTSFYATNQIVVRMDMVNGGVCVYVESVTRGSKMFPRFFLNYASNQAPVTNATLSYVTFNLPDGTLSNATWHKASVEGVGFFIGKVYPNWNSTWVGNYFPTATATDIYGNTFKFTYQGRPFTITPVPLVTTVQLSDSKSGQTVTGLYSQQNVNISVTVAYSGQTISGTEILPGFAGPLDQTRGGTVSALVGWGFFNATSNTFGSSKNPGGLVATVKTTYTGSKGIWAGSFNTGSLPALPVGANYQVIVTASDSVPTPNTGSATVVLGPATIQTTTTTSTSTSTSTSTLVSTATLEITQIAETIPVWAYAVMAAFILVGLAIGLYVRRQIGR